MANTGTVFERELVRLLNTELGCIAIRAGGSQGQADIMAVQRSTGICFVIEAKSTRKTYYRVSESVRTKLQFAKMVGLTQKDSIYHTVYALRWIDKKKNGLVNKWEFFNLAKSGKEHRSEKGIFHKGEGVPMPTYLNTILEA